MNCSFAIEGNESHLPRDAYNTTETATDAQHRAPDAPTQLLPTYSTVGSPPVMDAAGVTIRKTPRWKHILDVTLILLLFPVWLPVMVLISLFIKCTSKGPIIFRQERIGQGGKTFRCYKFRSMKMNAETRSHESHMERLMRADAPMTKLESTGDSRLIYGGGLFRAMGLDELPQLLNVLRGDMSLVGPRPCTRFEFSRYDEWQRRRFEAPAGLTGYWQVNGKNRTTFREMIEMDIYYAEHLSLSFDLWILFRTFPALVVQILESQSKKFSSPQASSTEPHPSALEASAGNL